MRCTGLRFAYLFTLIVQRIAVRVHCCPQTTHVKTTAKWFGRDSLGVSQLFKISGDVAACMSDIRIQQPAANIALLFYRPDLPREMNNYVNILDRCTTGLYRIQGHDDLVLRFMLLLLACVCNVSSGDAA